MKIVPRLVWGGGAFASLLASASVAHAIECKALPKPVYGIGGSAAKPLIGKVAGALTKAGAETIVYQAPGACFGINALIGNTKITGTASYWDADAKEQSCDLPIAGQEVSWANMGNSATVCAGVTSLPADVGDFPGSAQAFTLIVPTASSQQSISREGAYLVFGLGAAGQASPWVDDSQIYRRDANSAAQLFIALATGVPAEKFKGVDTKNNQGTVTGVSGSPKPEAAIGLVGGEVADANRSTVRVLAYQHTGQTCGYWPDSTPTAFDKRNVRSGQYYIWAPQHFFARLDASKKIADPATANWIGYFTRDVKPPAGVNVTQLEIKSGTIPKCAMEVWRNDLGDLTSNAPAEPCGCYFDSVATGATTCQACQTDPECPSTAPHCRFGFCEVN